MQKSNLYPDLAPSAPPAMDHDQQGNPPPYYPPQLPQPPAYGSQQGPHSQQQSPTAIIINHQVASPNYGPYSTRVLCPFCHTDTTTKTTSRVGTLTCVLSATLAVFCGCCLCCLVPCCFDRFKDVEHNCRNCGKRLGLFKRL